MGATHLDAYAKLAGVEIAAVCARNARALSGDLSQSGGNLGPRAGLHDFSRLHTCSEWRELVEDDALDAIDICLPTNLHAELAIAALNSGKHVLCEKPMALTVADCERMIAAGERSGCVLMIAQVLRFWPEYIALREFVKSGEYGAVRSATFVRRCGLPDWSRWLPDEKRSGGAVLDLLIHDIDQALMLFGIPERVAAKGMGGVDTLMATFLYEQRMEVRVQGGWFDASTPFSMSFQLRAERAEMELTPEGAMLSDMSGTRRRVAMTGADSYDEQLAFFVECWIER